MQEVNYPTNESQLYHTLHSISRNTSHLPTPPMMHVHSPSRLELGKLARDNAMHCAPGMNAARCASSAMEHAYYRTIHNRDMAFIEPAHAQMPSHIHSPNLVKSVDTSSYNRQVALRAVQDGFKTTYPLSYSFFDAPWAVRLPACSNVDCKPNVMTQERKVHRDCRQGR
jgi:hypothetical protein